MKSKNAVLAVSILNGSTHQVSVDLFEEGYKLHSPP
jgi:hypothetical protein